MTVQGGVQLVANRRRRQREHVSNFNYQYIVGIYDKTEYRIGVRAEPGVYDWESFAVVLFYQHSENEYIEVAKVDNSEHADGRVHFDRYYRSYGAERKDFDVEVESLSEAESLLRDNWQRYARLYEENHGTR